MKTLISLLLGALFGFVLIATGVFHWYRIQEMFHFDSFHMFGVLGSAIATAALGVWLLKKAGIRSVSGKEIKPVAKERKPFGNVIGGLFFGIGWAITGACTAPVFVLVGLDWKIGVITIVGVLTGTILYASIKSKLPQ